MASDKWSATGDGSQRVYSKGDFTVTVTNYGSVAAAWVAHHKSVRIKVGRELDEVLDYCDQMARRFA